MGQLIAVIIVIIIILAFLFSEYPAVTWSVIGAIVAAVFIGIAIYKGYKRRKEADAERTQNLKIISAPEPQPKRYVVPTIDRFSCEEEKSVNLAFQNYLRFFNDKNSAGVHLDYLTNRARALRALKRINEATQVEIEIQSTRNRLTSIHAEKKTVYDSKYNRVFLSDPSIMQSFDRFAKSLSKEDPFLRTFCPDTRIKIVKCDSEDAFLFTPGYVLFYDRAGLKLSVISYADLQVSSILTTDMIFGSRENTDEVARVEHLHQTKSGLPDMRYRDNPLVIYVYRGKVNIGWKGNTCSIDFGNRSLTLDFEQAIKNYMVQMKNHYKKAVLAVLNQNEALISAGSLNEFLSSPPKKKTIANNASQGQKTERILVHDSTDSKAERAFDGGVLRDVDPPASVKTLAANSFGEEAQTLVSIDGDAVELAEERDRIANQKKVLEESSAALTQEQHDLATYRELYKAALHETPDEWDLVERYWAEMEPTVSSADANQGEKVHDPQSARMEAVIGYLQSVIADSTEERTQVSVLRVSARREIAESIDAKNSELVRIRQSLRKRKQCLYDLSRSYHACKKRCEEMTEQVSALQNAIDQAETELSEREALWKEKQEEVRIAQEKIKIAKEQEELRSKKRKMLPLLIEPVIKTIATPTCSPEEAMIEKDLLYRSLEQAIRCHNQARKAEAHATFQELHTEQIAAVQEINQKLGLEKFDGIERFRPSEDASSETVAQLPERFKKLNRIFRQDGAWESFLAGSAMLKTCPVKKNDPCDRLFAEEESLRLKSDAQQLLLLYPYCAVYFPSSDCMSVLTYQGAKATVSYQDKTECRNDVPSNGEQVSERKMYLNADGTPDRRRRDNPTVKVIRYTTLILHFKLSTQDVTFSFNMQSYENAMRFADVFNAFAESFENKYKIDLYRLVLASADEEAIDRLVEKQARDIEREKKEAEAAKREEQDRLERERIAAQKAAEEKKAAALRRQQEMVEERRRQREEAARIQRLFGDDEQVKEDTRTSADTATEENTPVFAVVGQRSISNNTFKITLTQNLPVDNDDLFAYFVDSAGNIISNKKRVSPSNQGGETQLGFVLTAGIDYTKMKSCTLRVASASSVYIEIGFEMHIAFFSDF